MDTFSQSNKHASTVLIIDDEPINLTVFGNLLKPYYNVLVANSASRALQIVEAAHKPDLILLDVMMPVMDGFQLLAELKARPDTITIPVIFVTALDSDYEEERGLELGAVDFITKPCHSSTLLARIRTQLELKNARDCLANQNVLLEAELQRRQLENEQVHVQLLQSEKMASIGQLAAGIAHEINNPIGFVNSNLNTLKSYLDDLFYLIRQYGALIENQATPEAVAEMQVLQKQKELDYLLTDAPQLLDESLDGLSRVRVIIQDLKTFSHVDNEVWTLADLNQCLDSTLNIIWNELKYHCTVIKNYGELPQVLCLPAQLNQVFMNLLINAAHAIKSKGQITISTGETNQEVWVAIEDTGHGIAPENLSRLFEPFFTTKPAGKGTGLGLSISQSIVQKHHGRIEVESEQGKGTRFRVCLPIQQAEPSANDSAMAV